MFVDAFLIQGEDLHAEGPQGFQRRFARRDLSDALVGPVEDVPDGELQQCVLGGEVGFQGAVGEARLHGDLAHGGALQALPGDDPPGGVHQFQAALIMVNYLRHRGHSPENISLKLL